MSRGIHRVVLLSVGMLMPVEGFSTPCVPSAYQAVAAEWQVPADVLYAISLTESGRYTEERGFNIWPWALNIDGESFYPDSRQEALALIQAAIASGTDKIAIGLMQVFWSFHKDTFLRNPDNALDIASNLRAGAKIFRAFLDDAPNIWSAVGHYYAGPSSSLRSQVNARQYTERVQQVYIKHVLGRCHAN